MNFIEVIMVGQLMPLIYDLKLIVNVFRIRNFSAESFRPIRLERDQFKSFCIHACVSLPMDQRVNPVKTKVDGHRFMNDLFN